MEVDPINIVVVGRVGNGKSATGNSILGKEAFVSHYSLTGTTRSSELKSTILNDGRIVNVIDTPGLFNLSTSSDVISGEIVKCLNLAKEGIHAVLMVYSLRTRFTKEEVNAIESMKSLYGDKIVDHIILVFTNGDILESEKKSLMEFIGPSSVALKNIIQLFKNRVIVLDNTTNDMIKREKQVNELLSVVESLIVENSGKPYTNKFLEKLKVEGKGKLSMEMIWKQLIEEEAARLKAEEKAARLEAERLGRESLKDEEIQKLKEDLNEIRKQCEEFKKHKAKGQTCAIL